MSSSSWQNLPDPIFGDIMMMVGLKKLEDFQKCRQVCQRWYLMISQMTKYEKNTMKKKSEDLAASIRARWKFGYSPLLLDICNASFLAHHGLLGSVARMVLRDVDLASVPAEHLASLASCVLGTVRITGICNCDLIPILDNLKCYMTIVSQSRLSCDETRALVRSLESRVKSVQLWGEVSLDIGALVQYSGWGECRELRCCEDTADRYGEELSTWARRRNLPWQHRTEHGITQFYISRL